MLLWLALAVNQVIAQDSIVDQEVKVNQQFWLDYNFANSLSETQFISTMLGYRSISPSVYNRFLAISTLNMRAKGGFNLFKSEESFINSYQLGAGVIYTRNFDSRDNFELRLIQGAKFNIPTLKGLTFYNYTRIEQRLQSSFDGDWRTGLRLRHRISLAISWKKHFLRITDGLYFPISAEIFFNLKRTERFNDLVRISPGIGYKINSGWRFELHAIYNRTRNLTETSNTSNDLILRLRIYKAAREIDDRLAPANEFDTDEELPEN